MIFVTGGTGKIGQELLRVLAHRGTRARVLVRSPEKIEWVRGLGHEAIVGDLNQVASWEVSLRGIDRFFLLTNSTAPENYVKEEQAALAAAERAGVERIVLLSALGAARDSAAPLLRAHGQVESYLRDSGLNYTILRPNSFMQNWFTQADAIKQGSLFGNVGEGKVAFVDARDISAVAAGVLLEAGHDRQTYTITGGEALTYRELAAQLTELVGHTVQYVDLPQDRFVQALKDAGRPAWLAESLGAIGHGFAQGHGSEVTSVVEQIGKKRPFSSRQFLADHRQVFA